MTKIHVFLILDFTGTLQYIVDDSIIFFTDFDIENSYVI
jgi:hypothetical protein